MATNTIRETITAVVTEELGDSIISQYAPAIDTLVKAVEEREYNIREAIIADAEQLGYESEAVRILDGAGVAERPAPEPEPEAEAPAQGIDAEFAPDLSTEQKLDVLIGVVGKMAEAQQQASAKVERLVEAAQRNGITV